MVADLVQEWSVEEIPWRPHDAVLDVLVVFFCLGSTEFGKCLESQSSLVDICLHNVVFILETKGKTHGPNLLHRLSKWKGTNGYHHHVSRYLLHWSPLSKEFNEGLEKDRLVLLHSLGTELLE